jgi:hypothetical protein
MHSCSIMWFSLVSLLIVQIDYVIRFDYRVCLISQIALSWGRTTRDRFLYVQQVHYWWIRNRDYQIISKAIIPKSGNTWKRFPTHIRWWVHKIIIQSGIGREHNQIESIIEHVILSAYACTVCVHFKHPDLQVYCFRLPPSSLLSLWVYCPLSTCSTVLL